VVCDRWLLDSLVDLEVRYGRHRVAELALRGRLPRPDLEIFLDVDAAIAAARKPGDQDESVLARKGEIYARRSRELGLAQVDARGSRQAVDGALRDLVGALGAPAGTAGHGRGAPLLSSVRSSATSRSASVAER